MQRTIVPYTPVVVSPSASTYMEASDSSTPTQTDLAIPVSVGRRLDFVRSFTGQRQLPDLSSLVVNKTTGECGIGFTRSFNPEEARASVFAFDWRSVSTEFTGAVAAARKRNAPRKKRTEAAAAQVMYEYFTANKSSLPTDIKKYPPQILRLLIEGEEPSEAYAQGLKS